MNTKKVELYTFICRERDFTINIANLTWQQALIEENRKFWEYTDLLPQEMRDTCHVNIMLNSVITIK